jgi:purine-nucleoside phosphorylase
MKDLYDKVMGAAKAISDKTTIRPEVGIVLGTGLGTLEESFKLMQSIPYEDIPHFPRSTAPGHSGNLLLGELSSCPVTVLQGRFHFYEGYSAKEITLPTRVLSALGVQTLILTNASGGLNPLYEPGDLMVIADHVHMIPANPLRGLTDERLGNPFPDMSKAYDPDLLEMTETVALGQGISLRRGVYVGIPGPSLETPAETRLLRAAGADAVGMSTTSEVIVARSVGMRVLGISLITNVNRPDCMEPILVDDILRVAREAAPKLMKLIEGIVEKICREKYHTGE